MTPRVRLALACMVSGTALTALAEPNLEIWPAGFLWAVPALVAVRCLPPYVGVAVAFCAIALGRGLVELGTGMSVALGSPFFPFVEASTVIPALLLDRAAWRRSPRFGFWVWPVASAVTQWRYPFFFERQDMAVLQFLAAHLGVVASTIFIGLVTQGVAAVASLHNDDNDGASPATRDAAARTAAMVAFVAVIVVVVARWIVK